MLKQEYCLQQTPISCKRLLGRIITVHMQHCSQDWQHVLQRQPWSMKRTFATNTRNNHKHPHVRMQQTNNDLEACWTKVCNIENFQPLTYWSTKLSALGSLTKNQALSNPIVARSNGSSPSIGKASSPMMNIARPNHLPRAQRCKISNLELHPMRPLISWQ
jgi:hypothetical protein